VAQAPDAGREALGSASSPDPVAWWSELGRPGFTSEADAGTLFPWTLAGLVRGTWRREDRDRGQPGRLVAGAAGSDVPLAWYDSLSVTPGNGSAWLGFDGTLIGVDGVTAAPPPGSERRQRTRADVRLSSGSSGYSDNALSLRLGDRRSWLWGETQSFNRDGLGGLGDAGRHLYDAAAARTFGLHRVSGAFGQYGSSASLSEGTEGSSHGNGGHVEYRYGGGWVGGRVRLERGTESQESFGPLLLFSRRDAQDLGVSVELEGESDQRGWGARLSWRRESVRRATAGTPVFDAAAQALWAAGRWQRPLGDGLLDLEIGWGRHDQVDRVELAPALRYEFHGGPFAGRASLARTVTPVWSDLRAGQAPFLQSTWHGGIEVVAAPSPLTHAGASFMVGRTRDRAVVRRWPLSDLWLRSGFVADPADYDFALLTADASWGGRHGVVGVEGFTLGRDASPIQPLVDPGHGGRARADWTFLAFKGDLGVRVGADVAGLGKRESEGSPPRTLPGYVTYGASVVLALEDVRVTLRALNLEDVRRPETWVDPATGVEALGPGRELRFVLTWRLFD
jgi:hypothetical protein